MAKGRSSLGLGLGARLRASAGRGLGRAFGAAQGTGVGRHGLASRVNSLPKLALVFALLLTLGGCAMIPGFTETSIPPEQRAAYDAAMGRLPADAAGAELGLETFIRTYPESQLADDAAEQLAQLAFSTGRQDEGMRWLGQILSRYPDSDRAGPARLRLAQMEFARDKRGAARRLIEPLDLERLSLADQRAALRLRIALSQTPVERLEQLAALRLVLIEESRRVSEEGDGRARLVSRLEKVDGDLTALISRAASAELEEMVRGLDGRPPAAKIGLELSRRALDSGQLELSERRLASTARLVGTPREVSELEALRDRLARMIEVADAEAELPPLRSLVGQPRPRTDGARGTIGVVLPLSGDFAEFGEASLRGILLAADLFTETDEAEVAGNYPDEGVDDLVEMSEGARSDVRIVVRDSQGDPDRAARHVHELAQDDSMLAIVGPIFSQESLAAAVAAEEEGIPLVSLSARKDVPEGRANAFRTRTTPSDEVGVLVGHAFEELGAKRFAVLYPETRFGRGMRELYWDAVVERGGKMVAASSYDPDAVDFATSIRNMIGYRFLTNWEKKALDERADILRAARRLEPEQAALLRRAAYEILGPEGDPLPPIVDFDVLFIPDAADKIALIAPGLAFHEIRDVGLLGSSEWLDPELLRVARQHVSGAVISSPFYPNSELPFVAEFVAGYRNTFGHEPDVYAAEAFDAANLVLVQLSAGRSDRAGVRAGLLDTRAYPGATGVLTMHPNGNARRRPFLLRASGRRFRPLD